MSGWDKLRNPLGQPLQQKACQSVNPVQVEGPCMQFTSPPKEHLVSTPTGATPWPGLVTHRQLLNVDLQGGMGL